jgi:hypothetical protein
MYMYVCMHICIDKLVISLSESKYSGQTVDISISYSPIYLLSWLISLVFSMSRGKCFDINLEYEHNLLFSYYFQIIVCNLVI